jgi:hypothetical protein
MMAMLVGTGASPQQRAVTGLVFGVVLTVFGLVVLVRPASLAALLRYHSKPGDTRSYFAADLEQNPWKGRMAGAFAVLWAVLFVWFSAQMLMHPGA